MEITNLSKKEILKMSNKSGAYEFGRQKGYRDGFSSGCRVGERQANQDLQHYYDSTIGLWCIDKNPFKVNIEWIKNNTFRLSRVRGL